MFALVVLIFALWVMVQVLRGTIPRNRQAIGLGALIMVVGAIIILASAIPR